MRFKRAFSIVISVMLIMSILSVSAVFADSDGSCNESDIIDINVAATSAMLFVLSNIELDDNIAWNMNTNIDSIDILYNDDNTINGYCINLITANTKTGYVIVSGDIYKPLIQEYSMDLEFMTQKNHRLNSDNSGCDTKLRNENIYRMNSDKLEYDESSFVAMLKKNGLLNVSARSYISDPLKYLKSKYPNGTFTNKDYYNIGDNSIPGYVISSNDVNACGVYGTAALLKYYMPNKTFSSVLSTCKSVAVNQKFVSYDPSTKTGDYYLAVGELAYYVRACIKELGLSKNASSTMVSWSSGTEEISNNRPILLNIASSPQYSNHTVTAYAWTIFKSDSTNTNYRFFKIKDGYYAGSRYVCYDEISLNYITKVQ